MNSEYQNIREIASESARNNGLFLIDFIVRGVKSNPVIEVFIDGDKDVNAEDCAKVSNEIKKFIDDENLISSYRLDVSSPGVNRPLVDLRQYLKHINRMFEVQYRSDDDEKKVNGKLVSINENVLTFYDKTEIKVKFEDIIKAKVLVSFSQRR